MQDNVTQAEKAWHKHERSPYAKSAAEDEKHAFMCGFQAAHRLASTAQPEVKALVEALERAAGWFEEYATAHDKKMREAVDSYEQAQRADKAIRNAERAKELRQALAAYHEAQP